MVVGGRSFKHNTWAKWLESHILNPGRVQYNIYMEPLVACPKRIGRYLPNLQILRLFKAIKDGIFAWPSQQHLGGMYS